MTLSFHENIDYDETAQSFELVPVVSNYPAVRDEKIHLFADKMRIPRFHEHISRPRLIELLKKSSRQFGATLITGRAETGKTSLAAELAENYQRVAWYQIDAAETDWSLFARYFAAMCDEDFENYKFLSHEILVFIEKLFLNVAKKKDGPILIVLDDVHNVFDADWFAEFFVSLLYTMTSEMHLVLLSRTKPPQPLWRVRSKQVLGVIDEKLLAFNLDEAIEFVKKSGLSEKKAAIAYKKSFGRISRIKQYIGTP